MKNKPPQELVTVSLIDMDFVAVKLDLVNCNVEVVWLRQVGGKECQRGLDLAAKIAIELRAEVRKTHALVNP